MGVLYILPQAWINSFNLLDIAETILAPSNNGSLMQVVESSYTDVARFRPVYTISRFLLNSILSSANQYFFVYGLILGITLYITTVIQKQINKVNNLVFLILLPALLFNPVTIDTFWRLGTAENLFTLFLLLCLYSFIAKKKWFVYISFIVFIFSKETAIFFIPVFILYLYGNKKYRQLVIVLFLGVIYSLLLLPRVVTANNARQYTALFTTNITDNIYILIQYFREFPQIYILLIVILLIFFFNVFISKHRHNFKMRGLVIMLVFTSLFSLLFFDNIQAYYLFPYLMLSFLTLNIEFGYLKKKYVYIVVIFSLCILVMNRHLTYEKMKFWQSDYASDAILLNYLEKNPDETYYIDPSNRIDHIDAFEYLLKEKYKQNPKRANIIISRDHEYIIQYGVYQDLCSKTFFESKVCRWKVFDNSLKSEN
ncbi:MAG: hypothetical protein US54_C0008G0013 [Candidatus Roizmanbacteria bacterium GW2011_GWA2_37_7]|uniref:Uncharacterized protein n=1 Tax=Candidatus Roizmanbacteria bacterium GW2011_GWA2_37_7 TaxID=1618481 RepID=A0A0G0H5I6_9BACT|nr:MAG: hypothetical protein US54_C0008G0013 [Candidatus Roizmanbacteria bacterium GW2011_GWA2_37_7]